MSKVYLKDIAVEAGVSTTTVSFILNGKAREKRISPAVIEKVNKIITSRKFIPNTVARGLRTGKTTTLGVMVEDIGNHFFANVAKTIELEAYKKGYKVIFTSTDNDDEKAKDLLATLKNQQVEGLIITPTAELKEAVVQLQKEKKPFVLFDRYFEDVKVNHVILDNYSGAYNMTKHLISKGYKKIAFVTIKSNMNQMADRQNAYKKALQDAGLAPDEKRILELPFLPVIHEDYDQLKNFIQAQPDLDAVFFGTNYIGVLGLEVIADCGITVPNDLAVVSFDDHDLFRLARPPISVVAQPIEQLATEAINLLLSNIENKQAPVRQISIPAKLIIRASE